MRIENAYMIERFRENLIFHNSKRVMRIRCWVFYILKSKNPSTDSTYYAGYMGA